MYKRFKAVAAASMILLLILLSAYGGGTGCNGSDKPDTVYVHDTVFVATGTQDQTPPYGVEHHIYVTRDGQRCKIADANDNTEIAVNPQDLVTWHNEYGSDVQLNFGGSARLFGVLKAIVYADGPPLSLAVRPDAEATRHGYQGNCGATEPPPVIIVNPPN
ncbi:MAG: hypothetical protein HY770_01930 [Chitinivibrionia bacterium]|nr:hypothetical protein [Chitinivibrionia bacterium]